MEVKTHPYLKLALLTPPWKETVTISPCYYFVILWVDYSSTMNKSLQDKHPLNLPHSCQESSSFITIHCSQSLFPNCIALGEYYFPSVVWQLWPCIDKVIVKIMLRRPELWKGDKLYYFLLETNRKTTLKFYILSSMKELSKIAIVVFITKTWRCPKWP